MRTSARAVIIENGEVLTIYRIKVDNGKEKRYFVLPGGGNENGETLEETVKRELKEELCVDIKILGYLGKGQSKNGDDNYYHCEIVSGEPKMGGEEVERMSENNVYIPTFIPLSELESKDLFGKEFVLKASNGEYVDYDEKDKI